MNKEKLRDILNYAGSDKAEYEKIENEANCFARNILCPVSIVEDMQRHEPLCCLLYKMHGEFGITKSAYETRMSKYIYSEDLKNVDCDLHYDIVNKFYGFIKRMQDFADKQYEEYINEQIESGEFYASSSTLY